MKKLLFVALCVLLLTFNTACNQEDASVTTTKPTTESSMQESTKAEETTTAPVVLYEAPMAAISLPLYTEETAAEDGTVLFSYTRQDLSLIINDPMTADKIYADFLNRIDFENSEAKVILQNAKNSYSGKAEWTPYFYSIIYNPVRLDQNILSFYGTETNYSGGPRSSSVNISVTYDLNTGSALSLKELLLPNYSAEDLCDLIITALAPYADNELLFWDYQEIITDMFFTNTTVDTWFLSENGLCFYFNPYEIAPYSTGTVLAEVPYEKLGQLLKESYFPAEQVDFIGSLVTKVFEETDTDIYSAFAELVLEDTGAKTLISTNGTLFGLRLEIGSWTENSNEFTSAATVFAAEAITSGSAVIIQASREMLANLRLTYETEGVTVSQKIMP